MIKSLSIRLLFIFIASLIRTGLRIHIRTAEQSWSSVDQNFDETKFQFTPLELKPFPNRKKHHNLNGIGC